PACGGRSVTTAPTITAPLGSTTVTRSVASARGDCANTTTEKSSAITEQISVFMSLSGGSERSYFAANVSALKAGLILIVLKVISSVGLPSIERAQWWGSIT